MGLWMFQPSQCAAQDYGQLFPNRPAAAPAKPKPSWTESISSSFKRGADKFSEALKPKTPVKPASDPVALSTKATPTAELYTAVGRLHEESGQFQEALKQYEKALSHTPDYLGALLGYARVKDHFGDTAEATKLYQRAVKAHPDKAAVYNNLGAFYGRHDKLNEAVAALKRAVRLEPNQPKYRNNLAVIFVEMGRTKEAFEQLRETSPEAVAYYNLGYLLSKKGQSRAAAHHFDMALRIDPSMAPARTMLARLASNPGQTGPAPAGSADPSVRLGSRPGWPPQAVPSATSQNSQRPPVYQIPPPPRSPQTPLSPPAARAQTPILRRLPPTSSGWREREAASEVAPMPPRTSPGVSAPTAPLPPMQGPMLGPISGVN